MKFKYDSKTEKLQLLEASHNEFFQLKNMLIREVKGAKWNPAVKARLWDGMIDHFKGGYINLGLWKECYKLARYINVPFEIVNKEDFPIFRNLNESHFREFIDDFFKDRTDKDGNPFYPYEHQISAAFKILKNRYCTVEIATAGGKSLVFSMMLFYILKYIKKDAKFLLIVPNTNLVTQFYDDLMDYNLGYHKENQNPLNLQLEEIMSDRPRRHKQGNPNIYIGTYQSLENEENWPKEWFKQFYFVATDEAHTGKAPTVISVVERTFCSAYIRYGMTGTLPPETSAEFQTLCSLFGPKVAEVRADYLMDLGIVSKLKIRAFMLNHEDPIFQQRLMKIRKAGDPKKALDLEKEYVRDSEKRTKFIVKVVENCKNNVLVLFYIKDYGKSLAEAIKKKMPDRTVHYIDGDINNQERSEIKKMMEDTSKGPQVLVASFGTLSTGVNIKAIFNIVFTESFKSDVIIRQSIGRGLRLHPEKDKLYVFDIVDMMGKNEKVGKTGHYNHYVERKAIYDHQKYPNDSVWLNL